MENFNILGIPKIYINYKIIYGKKLLPLCNHKMISWKKFMNWQIKLKIGNGDDRNVGYVNQGMGWWWWERWGSLVEYVWTQWRKSRPQSAAMSSVNLASSMPSAFRADVRLVGWECQFAASDASFFPNSSRPLPSEYIRVTLLISICLFGRCMVVALILYECDCKIPSYN